MRVGDIVKREDQEGDKADVSDSTWTNYKSGNTQLLISNIPSLCTTSKSFN